MGDYKKRGKPSVSFLSEDIVEEILIRIPAEKLIEFKVVCTSWYRLISDRKFVESHLRHWKSRPAGVIYNVKMSDERRHCSLSFDLKNKETMKANSFNLNLEDCISAADGKICPGAEFRVLSSCNGLLLFSCGGHICSRLFVCNPITKFCTMLPFSVRDFKFCSWTLAYDSSIQKYKVFGLLVQDTQEHNFFGIQKILYMINRQPQSDKCYAFTLGGSTSDNWRQLSTSHSHYWISPISVSAKGKLHWVASFGRRDKSRKSDGDKVACLLSMDIATEEFKETPCPLPNCSYSDSFLEMNGCLYFIHAKYHGLSIHAWDVWVLKDWDTMIWSKDHVIKPDSILFLYRPSNFGAFGKERHTRCITMVNPLHSMLIIQHEEELVSYGLQCRELRQIPIHGQGIIPFFNYAQKTRPYYTEHLRPAHVNSLVSWH